MQKPLSRLEKFIYALCGLDSSELPNPLSRLEVLLNCLVTGETPPAFEPLSRNEKYLMAISGSYHDELPNPISRGEKLLYKLATGDDSIDDIGEALSRYEELLAYIVENGCLDGPIDVEYVTYILMSRQNTLYNTAKKPVKSAILKGQTLVNHFDLSKWGEQERITLVADGTSKIIYLGKPSTVKADTKYLTIIPIYENTINNNLGIGGWNYYDSQPLIRIADGTGIIKKIETTRNTDDRFHDRLYMELWAENTSGQITFGKPMLIEYQEGMENWDIPYFEGMQSVKMPVLKTTGKNLFDPEWLHPTIKNSETINGLQFKLNNDYTFEAKGTLTVGTTLFHPMNIIDVLEDGATYTVSGMQCQITNHDGTQMWGNTFTVDKAIQKDIQVYQQWVNVGEVVDGVYSPQIEENSVTTPYEPYKSNILTTSEDVVLSRIGDVRDELNLLTGELNQRIGKIVLDGSSDEDWYITNGGSDTHTRFVMRRGSNLKPIYYVDQEAFLCSKFKCVMSISGTNSDEMCLMEAYDDFFVSIIIDNTKLNSVDVDGFKLWLQSNPVKINYVIEDESIKTVDLSVVDQDGNNTKLSTFNDITHVTLSSEGLIPEAELKVATKNVEVLNTMSLKMDDIYATQTTLEETSNAQSENVDATMIATTEIYEGLL